MLLKKNWRAKVVRKGYHIQKPGSPSGYQSILTNFEACTWSTIYGRWASLLLWLQQFTSSPNLALCLEKINLRAARFITGDYHPIQCV